MFRHHVGPGVVLGSRWRDLKAMAALLGVANHFWRDQRGSDAHDKRSGCWIVGMVASVALPEVQSTAASRAVVDLDDTATDRLAFHQALTVLDEMGQVADASVLRGASVGG